MPSPRNHGHSQTGIRSRPNVALIVETSMGSGRNILRGIARYSRQQGLWVFHHEWRNTDLYAPTWLEEWRDSLGPIDAMTPS